MNRLIARRSSARSRPLPASLALIAALLAGCGQTGPLYLPDASVEQPVAVRPAATSPAVTSGPATEAAAQPATEAPADEGRKQKPETPTPAEAR